MDHGVNEPEGEQADVLEHSNGMNDLIFGIRTADEKEAAIGKGLGSQIIVAPILREGGEFPGIRVKLLDAEGAERKELSLPVAPDAG